MPTVECQNCGAIQVNVPTNTVVKMCFDCVKEMLEVDEKDSVAKKQKQAYSKLSDR